MSNRGQIRYSGRETYTLELTDADIQRLANALSIAANSILKTDGEVGLEAVKHSLGLREDILAQRRAQKFSVSYENE